MVRAVSGAAGGRPLPRRLLVVLHGAIGDVTRALPLLCRLRRGLPPASEIFWAVEPAAEPLLRHHPALAGVEVFARARGARAFPGFLARVRRLGVDCTLDLQRHLKSGVVALASGARRRVGFDRSGSREGNFLFQTERLAAMPRFSSKLGQFLAFADHLGVAPAPVEFGLRLLPAEERRVETLLAAVPRPFAALPVGSTSESRLWFPEQTARVVAGLAERGLAAVLLGAPGEEPLAAAVAAAVPGGVHDLCGRTGLRELAGVLARAAVAVAPDSGPMHIAAAMGTPVVSLWGATSAARSAPWGSEELVLEGSAPCMPCYRRTCPIGRECMRHITPDGVLQRVDAALALSPWRR